MKKKIALLLTILMASSMGLTGCGDTKQNESSKNTEATVGNDKTEVTKSNEKPVTLSVTWWGSQARHESTQKVLDLYTQKNPNVKFETTPSGWDGYFEKLSTMAAGQTLPDIMQMDYLYISTYSNNNTLADLQPYADKKVINLDNVDANLYGSGRVNNKLTGIVLSSAALAFPYNPSVFDKAGVNEPTTEWTWDDFEKACIEITNKTGAYGFADNVIDANIFSYWVRQYGKTLFSPDGKQLGYDDDKVFVDFVSMLQRLQDAKSMPTPDEFVQINSLGKEAGPVVTGEGATKIEWSNFANIVEKANPDIKLAIPPYSTTGKDALWIKPGMFFSVAENSKVQEESAKFIDWFINDEEANKIIMAERGVPVSSSIRELLKPSLSPKQQQMFDYIDVAIEHSSPIDPPEPSGTSEINKLLVDVINKVAYKQSTPEQAAAEFRKTTNDILARNSK